MTYWNPIEQYGVDRFAADLAAAGGAGLITPDLIPGGGRPVAGGRGQARPGPGLPGRAVVHGRSGVAGSRRCAAGFVYAASVMGVTGARPQTSVGRARRWWPGSAR